MTKKANILSVALAAAAFTAEQGWYPHEGGLMKYRVAIRFGEEPEDTMPAGWKFGRVSSVATNPAGTEVYVFQRGKKADPLIVFDNKGKYLGAMESPGHWLNVSSTGEIYIGSFTGNVFRWYPGGLGQGFGATEGLRPAD